MWCDPSTIDITIFTDLPCRVALSLIPDDVEIPAGLSIVHDCVDGKYTIQVCSQVKSPRDVLTLKNTVDELLRLIKVIATVEKF